MSRRRSYRVAELKSTFPGLEADAVQQALNQIGLQGRELVSVQNQGLNPRLYSKRGE